MKKNKRNRRAPRVKPDDYFSSGPFELARFGKNTIMRSRLTKEQFATARAKMAAHYPSVVAEINVLVCAIADQVARLPPELLLQRAWWEFATQNIRDGGARGDTDQVIAMRMVDYVQSVIASIEPQPKADDVSEEAWALLRDNVETLFSRLVMEYQTCLTAIRQSADPELDMELEEFRAQAEMYWLTVRGKRYHVHEYQALLEVLMPHSDVLERLFGIGAAQLVDELGKILAKLTGGLSEAMGKLFEARDRFTQYATEHPDLNLDEVRRKVFEDQEFAEQQEKVAGELFGLDLFDVGKITALPEPLLKALSWTPGEDTEFFAPGEFCGWPMRIWPVMKRPFLRVDGQVLCFDIFSLFDNFYRVLRRAVIQLEPAYVTSWNERQKAVTEELPFTYLCKALPGARVYKPVYYRWSVSGAPAQWCEADGLVIFEDHLIVLEVKAGAFTYTSPANDLASHLMSLKNLLQAPARQGSRFVDYLESAAEVPIADEYHAELARLRRADFRHVTVCAVTLDAFTGLAARAQHLRSIGIDVGSRPVWPVSIDDLRVYAEVLGDPLTFLHFIEQRVLAGQSQYVELNDEMDHLGLYLVQNNYSQYAAELMAGQFDRLNFNGYQAPVDEYYSAVLRGEAPRPLRQEMPDRLAQVIDFLVLNPVPRRAELSSFLLGAAGEFRDSFASMIDQALRENPRLGRARPFSVYGGMAMTLYVWTADAPRLALDAQQHTRAVMAANHEANRRLIELVYDQSGSLAQVHMSHVSLAGLSDMALSEIREASVRLQTRRISRAQSEGKIGRNEPCPCNSGKKYKKCHGIGS